jgi:hypothetical protein
MQLSSSNTSPVSVSEDPPRGLSVPSCSSSSPPRTCIVDSGLQIGSGNASFGQQSLRYLRVELNGLLSPWSICAVLLIVIAAQNLRIGIALFFLILGTCVFLISINGIWSQITAQGMYN